MSVLDIQDELLHLEYPFLLPDHDPEIERYYEFRAMGRSHDALNLFQNRLKSRYPDDVFRTHLMRSYRSRDPAYRTLLAEAYRSLGARSLERIKRIIEYITNEVESYNEKDVYSTIKAAENILQVLPREKFEAVAGIERYHRYAQHLHFRENSTFKASELVRAYLTESLSVVEEERRRRKDLDNHAKAMEKNRLVQADWENYEYQKKHGIQNSLINLSTVVFSKEDLDRIEIPKAITSIEDQTLAYCIKYWNNTNNSAFERILFLYSRKYGTKNYDVYVTIRRGQQNKNRDDEILSSVLSVLVTGYYYSIQGDIYLQRTWNRLKDSLSKTEKPNELPVSEIITAKKKKIQSKVKTVIKPKKTLRTQTKINAKKENRKTKAAEKTISTSVVEQKQKIEDTQARMITVRKEKKLINTTAVRKSGRRKTIFSSRKMTEKPTGSVSDRLQKLSGRSYDVYQDRFLTKARSAIRKVLGFGKGMFYVIPEDVEDLLYKFLRDHYSDPYMNWESSDEKQQLAGKGFALDSLDSIIEECYKRLA
jgi:hypothetical protein